MVSLTPVANVLMIRKFTTVVIDTGCKFATGINNTGGNLPPVPATPSGNLLPISMKTGATWHHCQLHWSQKAYGAPIGHVFSTAACAASGRKSFAAHCVVRKGLHYCGCADSGHVWSASSLCCACMCLARKPEMEIGVGAGGGEAVNGDIDIGGKFTASASVTSGNLPQVQLILAAYLTLVAMTPVITVTLGKDVTTVSTTPLANLLPVSMVMVVRCHLHYGAP